MVIIPLLLLVMYTCVCMRVCVYIRMYILLNILYLRVWDILQEHGDDSHSSFPQDCGLEKTTRSDWAVCFLLSAVCKNLLFIYLQLSVVNVKF